MIHASGPKPGKASKLESVSGQLSTRKLPRFVFQPSRWMLAELPRRAQALVVLTASLAITAAALSAAHALIHPPGAAQIWRAMALAGAGVAYGELRIRVHALHRLGADARIHSNTVSFWLVVAAVTTTPTLTLLACAAVFTQQVTRACLSGTAVPHRVVYVGSVVSLTLAVSSRAASALSPDGGSPAFETVLLAATVAAAYLLIPLVGVAAVMALANRSNTARAIAVFRARWPKPEEWRSEVGLVTAGLLAGELIDTTPWLTAVAIVMLTVVHLLSERHSIASASATMATAGATVVDQNDPRNAHDCGQVIGDRHLAAVPAAPGNTSGPMAVPAYVGSARRHWSTLNADSLGTPASPPQARVGIVGQPAMMTLTDLRASAARRRALATEQGLAGGRSRKTVPSSPPR